MKNWSLPALAAALLVAGTAHAQDREWPCQQRLVPQIAVSSVWTGPPLDQAPGPVAPDVAALAKTLEAAETSDGDVVTLINRFAAANRGRQANQRLVALFTTVFNDINVSRGKMIDGIRRFTRGQITVAEALSKDTMRLSDMTHGEAPVEGTPAFELQQSVAVRQRIFEDREKTIPFMCEQPMLLEQRLGLVARTIAAHLKS